MATVTGEELYWIVTCAVEPAQLADFKKVVGQLVAASKEEPGTLAYEFSLDASQNTVHIFERYRDSNACRVARYKDICPICRPLPCARQADQLRGVWQAVQGSAGSTRGPQSNLRDPIRRLHALELPAPVKFKRELTAQCDAVAVVRPVTARRREDDDGAASDRGIPDPTHSSVALPTPRLRTCRKTSAQLGHRRPRPSWWAKAYHLRISRVLDRKPWMVGLCRP